MTESDDPTAGPLSPEGIESPIETKRGRVGSFRLRRRLKKAARSTLRRRLTRTGIGLVLLIVILVGATGGYLYYRLGEIGHVKVKVTPVAKGGAENILLVGSTSRCAVTPSKNFENFVQECEDDVNGVNSDVIIILRLVPGRTPTLLSIPRDTFVPDARAGGLSNKVDAALADGPDQLVQVIEQDFGITINHYVVLNFQSFANIVTALGGITMYFPTSLMDKDSGLDITHSGCLHISGLEALALVRARHLYYDYEPRKHIWKGYDPSGDIGRIERVHIFLKVLASEIAARGLGNPLTDNALLSAIAPDLTVDSTFSESALLHLVLEYRHSAGATKDYTLPVAEDPQTYMYKGYNYGLVVFPAQPQDQQTIDAFLGGRPVGARLEASSISVSVVNASGSGSPASTISALQKLGYEVKAGVTQPSVGPISETTVDYSSASHLEQAERVLRSLSGAAVLFKTPTLDGADVTVVTGSNVAVQPSSSPPVQTSSAQTSRTGAALVTLMSDLLSSDASTGASSSALSPPTVASPSIAPYDPRACPAAPKKS